jgi:hypothetical protein
VPSLGRRAELRRGQQRGQELESQQPRDMRLLALLLPAKLTARMLIRSVHQSPQKRRRGAATTCHTHANTAFAVCDKTRIGQTSRFKNENRVVVVFLSNVLGKLIHMTLNFCNTLTSMERPFLGIVEPNLKK